MSDRSINDLCPTLQIICREWLAQCKSAGLNVALITTWRSSTDQNVAKANGLSNASAGYSPHNCCDKNGLPASKAFDFGVFETSGKYITDGTDTRYRQAAEIGKALGLAWGGDFKSIFDPDHLELPSWKAELSTQST